jgi:argininosuccinate lyase
MTSKVSGMLREELHPVIQLEMLLPNLLRDFAINIQLITHISKAHVLMLSRRGIIEPEIASLLASGILALEKEGPEAIPRDPAREDAYFNYEAELIRRIGPAAGGRMHTGRSRNDLYATMDRIRARDLTVRLLRAILGYRRALLAAARRHAEVVMLGHTHLQPAQPITFGFFVAGIAHAAERDFERILQTLARVNRCSLGAGAIAGTGFPISRIDVAHLLGFDGVQPHSQDSIASRDYMGELLAGTTLATTTWGRMAQDFFFQTTFEVGTLQLPDSIAQTSSMMPQKKNMSALEVLRASAAQTTGALVTFMAGLRATHFSFGFDACCENLRWAWDALDSAIRHAGVAAIVVERAEPKPERMIDLARSSFATATDLADMLVQEHGFTFRDAHHCVGAIVRSAIADGLDASGISAERVERVAAEQFDRTLTVDNKKLTTTLDPVHAVNARRNVGGPSSMDLRSMLDDLERRFESDATAISAIEARLVSSNERLQAEFEELANSNQRKQTI